MKTQTQKPITPPAITVGTPEVENQIAIDRLTRRVDELENLARHTAVAVIRHVSRERALAPLCGKDEVR